MSNPVSRPSPVYVALDTTAVDEAQALAVALGGHGLVHAIKLGLEFFVANGPQGVQAVAEAANLAVFLDLKLYDIPNTVAGAMRAVVGIGGGRSLLAATTIHASGGGAMIRAACDAAAQQAAKLGKAKPDVLAVTMLTSFDQAGMNAVGIPGPVLDQVRKLALLARESGADGVVCSPLEVAAVRAECGPGFKIVVPGIRPAWAAAGDQKRIMTPREAMAQGADYLVIGRPITQADDPLHAARLIAGEVGA